MSGLTRDGIVESVRRDQVLRRERGQEKYVFLFSRPRAGLTTITNTRYPVDSYYPEVLTIHTYSVLVQELWVFVAYDPT